MIIPKLNKLLQRRPESQRVICVLGMHRSGTSFLTGSLQQAGVELHRYHRFNPHNRKGNRENQEIVEFNNRLLEYNSGSWDNPPDEIKWKPEHITEAQEIIEEYAYYPLWGFKDPRALLTFRFWRELIPHLEPVGIFRHPMAVACSLRARDNDFPIEQGLVLWEHYNRILLDLHLEQPFPIINFDQDEAKLKEDLKELCNQLDLRKRLKREFLEPGLISQQQESNEGLNDDILKIYQSLMQSALKNTQVN